MHSSIYLTGGTIDSQDVVALGPEADWRSLAMTKLAHYGMRVVNPLEFAWTVEDTIGQDLNDGLNIRVQRSLELIDQCDAVLANLNRSSYGTAMEIFYAYRRGKVVTVVGQSPFSPWVLSHSQARFGDIERALNYIIEDQVKPSVLPWALQYEALLAERYEQLPPSGEPDYKFLGGELPVLVLAPHATAYWREGEFQEADAYTGTMAALLNRLCLNHSMLTCYCCVADPCWYLETPFRGALADIVKAGQVGLVLVLLGSFWHESPGLKIHADAQGEDYANRLRAKLKGLEPVVIEPMDDRLGALHRFASEELAVPTVVLKMHKRYRMPRLTPEPFVLLHEALRDFIFEIGKDLMGSKS
jgi:hypothetical protein